jgi:long-chain acyl-CoA synthetase
MAHANRQIEPGEFVKSSVTPELLDSFMLRTVEAAPQSPADDDGAGCRTIAEAWRKIGLRPGDLVLLCLPNGKELLRQFFGVFLAGGVPALVTPMTPAARLREMAAEMQARAIGAFRLPVGDLGTERTESIGPLRIAVLPPTPRPAAAAGEVVLLTYGTSGFASGCVFDLDALMLNAQRHADAIGQRGEDVVLVSLPLYFSFALVAQALASLARGNRLVIGGPPFHVPMYRKTLSDFAVTVSSLTPIGVRSLLQSDAEFLSGLRVFSVGGDALDPELVARLLHCRKGGELYLTYGLTQAGPRVSTLAAHAEPPERFGSVGRPLTGTSVFLRDTGDGLGIQQLFVSSETVMRRTIGCVEGRPSHDALPPRTIATGDAFEQDGAGYLYFKGRLCDFINRKGEKVSLAAVRRIAAQLPSVVSARTLVIKGEDGAEDFDLELRVDASMKDRIPDGDELLRGLLRRTEMPRKIRITTANELAVHHHK